MDHSTLHKKDHSLHSPPPPHSPPPLTDSACTCFSSNLLIYTSSLKLVILVTTLNHSLDVFLVGYLIMRHIHFNLFHYICLQSHYINYQELIYLFFEACMHVDTICTTMQQRVGDWFKLIREYAVEMPFVRKSPNLLCHGWIIPSPRTPLVWTVTVHSRKLRSKSNNAYRSRMQAHMFISRLNEDERWVEERIRRPEFSELYAELPIARTVCHWSRIHKNCLLS